MNILSIDIETYSSVEIKTAGVYKYIESPDFEILLFSYAFDEGPVQTIDLTKEKLPQFIIDTLLDPNIIKTAYNANFERVCLSKHLNVHLPVEQWRCSSVHALYLGLPGWLEGVAQALKLEHQKDSAGKNLINYFSKPCKPTKSNGGRTRNLPEHDPEKWQAFIRYNQQDVEVERAVRKVLEKYPMPESEWRLWFIDQEITDRGVRIDPVLVQHAIECSERHKAKLEAEAIKLTGLENPNSVAQLKEWFEKAEGLEIESLNKKAIPALMKEVESATAERVLELRQELSKTSIRKYQAMERVMGQDGRARGLLQFYGANRTGRWCLTGDHEVLTPEGWVRLDKWKGGPIAVWNPKGEIVSFQSSEAVSFAYSGPMYRYFDKRIDQISTPDHKMYVKRKYGGEWVTDTVEQMTAYRPSIPFTGVRTTNPGLEHNFLRVLVMVQADGHYTADGSIRFAFKKEYKAKRCKMLLRKADITFSYVERADGRKEILIHSRHVPLWLRLFRDKTFGSWLFDESADVFFDELAYWDGYKSATNSIQYVTCNKQNADMVQAFAHLSGRCALLKVKDRSAQNPNWQTAYIVNVWLTPKNCHEIRNKPTVSEFNGKVYCAVTSTGYFLVRRNGRVWVTGNSGRLIQVQNLPRNNLPDLDLARKLLRAGDYESLELLFESVPDTLSQLIRTAIIPAEGHRFIVADFSSIEARVVAWLAGEKWRMDVFKSHGKIYEASAAQMFRVPIESINKGSPLRQKGKIAELALGYGGAVGALKAMDALEMGLTEDELPDLVKTWRAANPSITKFWWDVEAAAHTAVGEKKITQMQYGLTFSYESGCLFITLPSGRRLAYLRPKIEIDTRYNKPQLTYEGIEQKLWKHLKTYGPKLVENIVQAISRDCLATAIVRLHDAGYRIVFHVHDEVIAEMPFGSGSVEEMCEIMGRPIEWAPGLPLRADGFECEYYRKD